MIVNNRHSVSYYDVIIYFSICICTVSFLCLFDLVLMILLVPVALNVKMCSKKLILLIILHLYLGYCMLKMLCETIIRVCLPKCIWFLLQVCITVCTQVSVLLYFCVYTFSFFALKHCPSDSVLNF